MNDDIVTVFTNQLVW